jgi:glycosyltransferase involved in cell wall biosynthesis
VGQIADGISRVLGDRKFRERLVNQGYERLRDFDWRTTAAEVLRVLKEVGSGGAGDLVT